MIQIESLHKQFGSYEAVQGVSLSVPKGAFLVLVGPSGCGKSTILRMLAGLEAPTSGTIAFGGKTVSDGGRGWVIEPSRRDAGLVFQSYALWPHMTVAGNIDWPLKVAGLDRDKRRERVGEVLDLLGIGQLADRYPNEISGGQQQRVAIARMIAPKPGILLFDEPLSNLDAKLRVEMRTELLRVHRATDATSVYVTHDQVEAMTMATHVAVMNGGRIEQFASPGELVVRPRTAFVATFVGTPPANLVPVVNGAYCGRLADAALAGRNGSAMFRPEELTLAEKPSDRTLTLDYAEASPMAGRVMVTGIRGDLRLTAIIDSLPSFSVGDEVHFQLPPAPSMFFTPEGVRAQ
ncbi:ATP-binding cassette domain-containing protein [Sinorhizobium medicae]|uniref:ABC transporter ATP-binding protein n=1 Tax=Sinorhizobium medicae TaxID=110321 RepID=UPI0003FA6BB2|nr:ABC transporter ATP-binding protein [Sinorhizobium medicae]MDX0717227.1 ATP-binding cassette domain-containing protein [Sinorhizobium medicae]MDX0846774.1 ATP-binding cassette domain-containing protein [Sinorhizobium medicae]MDX0955002.1 ATP-binding cassette domain-containing protein [Sinorhizobium medicae]MDX1008427.1 ATP-binding cassette domain-containing protein [Sinorhizobium medicae]MDX1053657.1 ATP-binding cassette domain-containing protein [Sinorhizobium medicae]